MAIELPDLVQRIRVKTNELRAAEKAATRAGKRFDVLRASAADASDSMDELAESSDRAQDRLGRTERVTAGATRALSVLRSATDDADVSMSRAGRSTTTLGESAAEAADGVTDLGDAASDASDAVDDLGTSSRETSTDNDRLGTSTKKAGGSMGSFIKKVLGATGALKLLSLAVGSLKLAAIVAVVGQLGSGLISAAAGAVAFTSAIAPAAGILGAIPAGITALGTSALALKAIFGTVGDAVEAVNKYGAASEEAAEAAAGLGKTNLAFVNTYAAVSGVLDRVASSIRTAGLPGFTAALGSAAVVIRAVKDEMTDLGGTLGTLAQRGAAMIASGPFSRDLQLILARNVTLVETLGKAGLKLVNVLRNIMVAAGPMAQSLADLVLQGARWLDTITATGRRTGELRGFFNDALKVAKQLGGVLVNLTAGLFNVFSIGRDLGDDMFQTLRKNARQFREWTESVGGSNAIRKFFDDARPALAQFGKLTTALFKEFFTLQNSINFGKALKQIRKELLPAVGDAIRYFGSSGLTSAIIDAATAFVNLFNTLPINSMATLLTVVADLTNRLVDFGKANPIILQTIAAFLTFRAALKGVLFVAGGLGKLTGITSVFKAISGSGAAAKKGATGLRGFVQGLRGTEIKSKSFANKIGGIFNKGFSKIGSLAKRAGSRIGPALTSGVSKAKGGLVKAGKATAGAFASGFSSSKGAITNATKKAGTVLRAGLANTARGARTAGAAVAKGFGAGLSAIGAVASRGVAALSTAFAALRPIILAAAGAVKAFTLSLLTNPIFLVITAVVALGAALVIAYQKSETFRKIVDATFGAIRDVIVTVVSTVVNFVKNNWKLILVAITGPIGIAVALVIKYWDKIKTVFQAAVTIIRAVITRYFTLYRTIITTAVKVIAAVIKKWWSVYKAIISTAFRVIRAVISTAWNIITTVFRNAFAVIKAVFAAGVKFVLETWNKIKVLWELARLIFDRVVTIVREKIDAVVDTVRSLRDRVLGFFSAAGSWLYNIGRSIIQGLIDGITSMFGPLQDAFQWVTDRIPDWKGPIGKDEVLLYGAGRAIMRGLVKGINEGSGEVRSSLGVITEQIRNGIQIGDVKFPGVSAAIAQVADTTPGKNKATNQVAQTSLVKDLQKDLLRKAAKAAERENRLRARLPLLEGEDRQIVKKRIRELQEQQRRLTRRAASVESVKDLRGERQAALRRADQLAKQARKLRLELPELEGEDRRKAKAEIARLEEERAAEIRKARDIQTELIKVFRDLPQAVRELLREAQREAQEKREKERRKERREGRGGVGGGGGSSPSGTSNDPVFTSLTPGLPDPERKFGAEKGDRKGERREQREATRAVKRSERVMARFGKRLPDAVTGGARDTQKAVHGSGRAVGLTFTKVDNTNSRHIISAVREGRADSKRENAETRKNARTLSAAERAQIRESRARANADAANARALERTLFSNSKGEWDKNRVAQVVAQQNAAAAIVAAIRQVQAEAAPNQTGGRRQPGKGGGGGNTSNTTYNVTVNNPKGETTEESVTRRLRQQEVLGRRA